MSNPEGARKSGKFIAICTVPDYCWTPVGGEQKLVPYMIACDLSASQACSANVNFTGEPVFLWGASIAPKVEGSEPGVGGGVVSGVNVGTVWAEEHAKDVFVNGVEVARHGDKVWMNHKD